MRAELIAGLVSLIGGISYLALTVFLFRQIRSVWLGVTLMITTLLAACYSLETSAVFLFDLRRPEQVFRIQRYLSALNGVLALGALLGVFKERKKGK